jgi:predicted ATPase
LRSGERLEKFSPEEQRLFEKIPLAAMNNAAQFEQLAIKAFPPETYYAELLARRNEVMKGQIAPATDDWALIGITDHNVCDYAQHLSKIAWDRRSQDHLIILPGIELDVTFPVEKIEGSTRAHILLLFAPCTLASDIRVAITQAGDPGWTFGNYLAVLSLPDFIRKLRTNSNHPAICIAAHVWSRKGVQQELKRHILSGLDAHIARSEAELKHADEVDTQGLNEILKGLEQKRGDGELSSEVLRLIGDCGFDGLHVRNKRDEAHYRRLHRFKMDMGRAAPLICSDAHHPSEVFDCKGAVPHLKLPALSQSMTPKAIFTQIRDAAIRFGETRLSYTSPGFVTSWISGIEIQEDAADAVSFWPFKLPATEDLSAKRSFILPLSRNLNCFIGGRGSGKSALLEAIGFVARPNEYNKVPASRDDEPDWYKRARATLSGCRVRLCWQFIDANGLKHLPKAALFLTRYFDPKGRHTKVSFTDYDGNELTGEQVPICEVQMFRVHEIETYAHPQKLRTLFDDICGPEIRLLEEKIKAIREALKKQREQLVRTAEAIAILTQPGAPLTDYLNRMAQFAAVNNETVRSDYEQADIASAAETTAAERTAEWKDLTGRFELEARSDEVAAFFEPSSANLSATSTNLSSEATVNGVPVSPDVFDANVPVSQEALVLKAIEGLSATLERVASEFESSKQAAAQRHKAAKEVLNRKGLPTSGTARETKKRAFEEAGTALEQYRKQVALWERALKERNSLRSGLLKLCHERSELRRTTAATITARLKSDLDQSVLMVEADAQEEADKKELKSWLVKNLAPAGDIWRHRESRIDKMLAGGITADRVRDLLLSSGGVDYQALMVDAATAAEGSVDSDTADKIFKSSVARWKMEPEPVPPALSEEERVVIPAEIADGLWCFETEAKPGSRVRNVLELDEIIPDDIPEIRLNDRPKEPGSSLRALDGLSPGQRCSAILPILLLTGTSPLIIDQPEENLDNRLIRQVVVNILASIKLRRQVIVATHNPNLPVLGDVEQATILQAVGDSECKIEAQGDLDSPAVIRYVTEIMEGGREAFQYRQQIYQTHWQSSVHPV